MSICDTRTDGLDMFFAPTRSQRGGKGGGGVGVYLDKLKIGLCSQSSRTRKNIVSMRLLYPCHLTAGF